MSDLRQDKKKEPDCEITGFSSTRLQQRPRSSDSPISFLYEKPEVPGNNKQRGRRSQDATHRRIIKSELLRELRKKRELLRVKEEQEAETGSRVESAEVPAAQAAKQEPAEVPAALSYPKLLEKVVWLVDTSEDYSSLIAEIDRTDRKPALTGEQLDVLNKAADKTIAKLEAAREAKELKVELKEDVDDDR